MLIAACALEEAKRPLYTHRLPLGSLPAVRPLAACLLRSLRLRARLPRPPLCLPLSLCLPPAVPPLCPPVLCCAWAPCRSTPPCVSLCRSAASFCVASLRPVCLCAAQRLCKRPAKRLKMPRAELETRRSYKHLPQSRAGEHESTQNGRQSEAVQRPKPEGPRRKARNATKPEPNA